MKLVKKKILGVGITNAKEGEVLEYILSSLEKGDNGYYVVTPNPEILVRAHRFPGFKHLLNDARLACPDGIGVIWAGKILGIQLQNRVTGVNLVKSLCEKIAKKPITVGFLGGRGNVALRTAECLQQLYPGLRVVFAGPVDILFVAFGAPKQEEWMAKHAHKGIYKVAIGVGGAFDYLSGRVTRAPKIFRTLGLEWLFRLVAQPWRVKRQLALLVFVWLVFKEKLRS